MPMAQPGPDGQMTPEAELIAKAGSKMAFESAKLMGLSGIERDVNGGEFIGINGLSVTQEDIDTFRASVSGSSGKDQLNEALLGEELARAEADAILQEEAMQGGDPSGLGGGELDELGALLGAEGNVPLDDGASLGAVDGIPIE